MDERFIAWPFPIVKPEAEWTEFDRDFINFMQQAFSEGFQPRYDDCAIAINSPSSRTAFLIRRGTRNGWELCLSERNESVPLGLSFGLHESTCVCVRPPFRAAGHLALEWLHGQSLTAILADYEFVGGSPVGIELRTIASASAHEPAEGIAMNFDTVGEVPKWRELSPAEREEVRRLLSQGMNVGAIRVYRQASGLGLAESKRAVELLQTYTSREPLRPQTKPCPVCGQQLRTALAQQCVACGADWHARTKQGDATPDGAL